MDMAEAIQQMQVMSASRVLEMNKNMSADG
jgi:hypothetical protein